MDGTNTEAKLELASVLEDLGRKSEALEIVAEGELANRVSS